MFFNKYSLQQIEEYEEIFKLFKDDDKNSFSIKKLKSTLLSMGHHMSNYEITNVINKIDKNGDGLIQFEEFLYLLNSDYLLQKSGQLHDIVIGMFEQQRKQEIKMTLEDLEQILQGIHLQSHTQQQFLMKDVVRQIFKRADSDGNGILDMKQIMKLLMIMNETSIYK